MPENIETKWRDRVVGLEHRSPADLVAHPDNWRRHPASQREALRASLDGVGWVTGVILNQRTGRIVDGHARVEEALAAGQTSVPVLVVDLSEAEEKAVLATLDPIGEMANGNDEALAKLMASIESDDDALLKLLALMGAKELTSGQTDPDDVPAVPEVPTSKLGDLWILGTHRILCGDSTKRDDVGRLMDGKKAGLMATDPPYLVDYRADNHPQSYDNKPGVRNKSWDDYHDPKTAVAFFSSFLRVGLEHLEQRAPVYQWHADLRRPLVAAAWDEVGLLQHQVIQWVKSRPVLTRSHFMWQHEPCLYGWVKGNQPTRRPPANSRSVWEIDQKGEQDAIHPTQKPVELFLRPLEWHLRSGELAYEPFSGSGTCIIAAEMLKRRCFAMEIEPAFVDVAVKRWEDFTGRKAELSAK